MRRGLAPGYDVLEELAQGGMGVVFLAREPEPLSRLVAIKTLRPELATATALQRFLREAQLLANLKHPNIVPVHAAGEADGLPYYVMDFIEDETLAKRLQRGPLTEGEVLRLGTDLLAALAVIHEHGVIHRDIKPSNIFLMGKRALLADFGIARDDAGPKLTASTGRQPGTPGYMAPEQLNEDAVTPSSDIYAIAAVLYEAVTGVAVNAPAPVEELDWGRVPRSLAPVIRRGLSWNPRGRWEDAAAFRAALSRARRRPYVRRMILLTTMAAAGGAMVKVAVDRIVPQNPTLRIAAFEPQDGETPASLGDSLARQVARELAPTLDFDVLGPGDARYRFANVTLHGSVRASGDSVCAEVSGRNLGAAMEGVASAVCHGRAELPSLARQLSRVILLEIWSGSSALLADLPSSAVPRDARAVASWLQGERAFAEGRWAEAMVGFVEAEAIDSSCSFCAWRRYEAERWLGVPTDPQRIARFVAAADSFPSPYRFLMRAPGLPLPERVRTLQAAAEFSPRAVLVRWALGEELLHRAPLLGHLRSEAIEQFRLATDLRPDFAPGWEHLTWAYTTEGDSLGAAAALARWHEILDGHPTDTFTLTLTALVEAGFAWRFLDSARAASRLLQALATPGIRHSPYLPMGPRMLPHFEAWRGAIWLGRQFADGGEPPYLQRPGLMAMIIGFTALGRPDSADVRMRDLADRFPEEELSLFYSQLRGALLLFDPPSAPGSPATTWNLLESHAARHTNPAAAAEAAGMLALLQERGVAPPPGTSRASLESLEPHPFSGVITAIRDAREGRVAAALAGTQVLATDSAAQAASPVLRAVVKMLRAEWAERLGDVDQARRELRWAQNSATGLGTAPKPVEVDWAFRTIARWRTAQVMDRAGVTAQELCDAYDMVAENWGGAVGPLAVRADSARARLAALDCPARP